MNIIDFPHMENGKLKLFTVNINKFINLANSRPNSKLFYSDYQGAGSY